LIGDRIEQLAQSRDLLPTARQLSVEVIGQRCCDKNRDSQQISGHAQPVFGYGREQHHNQQRHNEDSRKSQRIREIHWSLLKTIPNNRSLGFAILTVKIRGWYSV